MVSKIALAAGLGGLAWMTAATYRWFIVYPDMSQCLIANLIGVAILFAAYSYNQFRDIDERFRAQSQRIDLITDKVFHIKPEDKL